MTAATIYQAAIELDLGAHKALVKATVTLVAVSLIGGFVRAVAVFFGGRVGSAFMWAGAGIAIAVIIASGSGIYMSVKRTADQTQITTGQYGQ
jgi:hypothetical protein